MWRYEGYAGQFMVVLQPASREIKFTYSFLGPLKEMPVTHITKHCETRIKSIERSRWN
jgi:hypothetical protein